MISFEKIKNKYKWKPIFGCPGRYILMNVCNILTPLEILDENLHLNEFDFESVKDKILIVKIENGALISYKKNNGTYVHTLNDEDGFARKLKMLGISRDKIK
jgi:hypothetical protein